MTAALAWLFAQCLAAEVTCTLHRRHGVDTIIICGIAPQVPDQAIPTHAWSMRIESGRHVTVVHVGTKCGEV